MSHKIAIITDSTCCLTEKMLKEHNIFINYLLIVFGNNTYEEFKDITPEKFVELSALQEELPTTSQSSPGLIVETYENLLKEGYDEIIHITISSGLSGFYQSAVTVSKMVDESKIHVFDSTAVTFPQGALAIEASKLAKAGKKAAEILPELQKMRKTAHMYAVVKKLDNLQKSGRLSNASTVIGNMLQIKPIISMSEEGKLEGIDRVRTFKKGLQVLIDKAKDANLDESYSISIMHMLNIEDAMIVKNALAEYYPNITIHVVPLSLVVSVHVGEGTIALTWVKTS